MNASANLCNFFYYGLSEQSIKLVDSEKSMVNSLMYNASKLSVTPKNNAAFAERFLKCV